MFLFHVLASLQTYEVRNNHPVSSSDKGRNHLPVEEGPGRLSVKAKHDRSIFWALVHIVDPWKGHPTTCLHKWNGSWAGNLHQCCSSWGQKDSRVFPGLQILTRECGPQWVRERNVGDGRWESKGTWRGAEQAEQGAPSPRWCSPWLVCSPF